MLKCEILSVGTELLMGQIANTNAQYISSRLPEVGLGVFYHSVIGDNPGRIKESVKLALSRCDVVITTGGLGPTQDDLTKDIIAEALNKRLIIDDLSRERIKKYFEGKGRIMVESNYRQAYFPEDAIILENDMGTAPGCIVEHDGKVIIMLPGPPKELIPMFEKVLEYFRKQSSHRLVSKFLRIVGVGESLVEKKILNLVSAQTNPTLATYAKDGLVTIRVTAGDEGGYSAEQLVDEMTDNICKILGDDVYTTDNEELEQTVFRLLKEKNLKIATAESCSGGILAELLTSNPGASQVFLCGAVTYSPESKISLVSVKKSTIDKYGVVSRETACEMAVGIREKTGADVGVSITGYAGPGSGSDGKPVGLVYVAVDVRGDVEVKELNLSGNRERIRVLSVVNALDMVRRNIMHI